MKKKEKKTENPISVSYWEKKGQSVNSYLLNSHYVWSAEIDSVWGNGKQKIVTIPLKELKI